MSLTSVASKRTLNDGNTIPCVGFGVYNTLPGQETVQSVLWALEAGFRHIDTAAVYHNEEGVGEALKQTNVPREEIFVTTKLWDNGHGYEKAKAHLEQSLSKLGLDYVDLYLIHSPGPGKKLRLESWKALEELQAAGKIKSIGVSNYGVHHLEELLANATVKPVVNQIEVTPYLARDEIEQFCRQHDIHLEAYSPLTMGQKLKDKKLVAIADKHGKSTAQILIRWSVQRGYIPLPKSVHKDRIVSNAAIFDFELSREEMETLNGFDEHLVTEWDPTEFD
ncbi:glyoxal reductase [Syncephalastrum racemosum]|uniref:Glyoxal reductase n=1 Tax=Syncephalastrum racemosum TaxID=13706 RepID=A0A1X2H2B9_SYNRA|nr:glyoxal reductase [Syncephalastrum racemosum]